MSLTPPAVSSSPFPAEPVSAPIRSRPQRAVGRTIRALLVLLASAWSLLLIAWLTLHWGILPHIQDWRGGIEARASKALGVPVHVGGIEVLSSGWAPSFELQDVTLQGPHGNIALRLHRVVAAISLRSLLSLELDFEQLVIEGAEIELRRDPRGHLFVAGLDLGDPTADSSVGRPNAAADWFFKQREFVVRGGSLRWIDEQRQAPALVLDRVDLVLRNTLRQHALRFDATPPIDFGARFSLSARFTQPLLAHRGDWRRWSGSLYANLPRIDVSQWQRHVTLPFDLGRGSGSVRGWLDVDHGEPTAATVDVALSEVALRLDRRLDVLTFARIEGRLIGRRDREGESLEAQYLSFDTGEGVRWPAGGLKFALQQHAGQAATGGSFGADRLDLGSMAQVANRIPLADPIRKLLAELRPQGVASDVDAHWQGALGAPAHYRVKGRLSGLSLAAKPAAVAGVLGRPGVRNADLQIDANEAGGSARIDLAGGAVDLPGVFEEPLLPLDRLAAQVLWTIEPASRPNSQPAPSSRITVQARDVRFANADAHGEFDARWTHGGADLVGRDGRNPGRLELDGTLADGVATRVPRYLPLALPLSTRHYLEQAVQAGTVTRASFHIHGDLLDFPLFTAAPGGARRPGDKRSAASSVGEFRILAEARGLTFAYVPGAAGAANPWPVLTGAEVELALDRGTFSFRNGRARVGDIEWPRINGAIEHLESAPVLTLDALARGRLDDMLRAVDATPVGGWIGHALAGSTATGNTELKLALGLPLTHLDSGATVSGSVTLNNNDVRMTPGSPLLGSARGRVDFTEKGFTVNPASARIYGGESTVEGGTQPDGSVRLVAQGTVSAEGLRRAAELGPVARIATALTGATRYRANLGFAHDRQQIGISSNLVGLSIDLPAPLAKAADSPWPMRYQTTPEPQPAAGPTHDVLQFELGNAVQAHYLRELSGDAPRVVSGGVGVFAAPPSPAHGVAANVELQTLDVEAWQKAMDKLFGAGLAVAAASSAEKPAAPGYEPDSVALRVEEFSAGGRRLHHLTAGLSQGQGAWRANLDADELAGYVEYRAANSGTATATDARVFARLSRLSLPKSAPGPTPASSAFRGGMSKVAEPHLLESDARQVSDVPDSPPASMPALDVVVDDLVLNGLKLGRVEVQAANRPAGPLRDPHRDWQLTKLDITTPEAQLSGSGLWAATGVTALRTAASPRRMVMDFKLRVDDSGALLTRLGTGNVIRGGKGSLSGRIAWVGSPFSPDYPSLDGKVKVAIDEGQFLKADPGAARLLGVLSLQSLPRRLLFDFRDVFDKGFAFDSLTGDLNIAGGVAQTRNLQMRGLQASVLMQGSADIEKETQDLRVVVVPEVSAGTAALAYAVVNPVLGLGALVAQALLKRPLAEAGTREFRVSGPWADPKVVPVARTPDDDALGVAPAASSAAKNH